ncbi:hypothetical protein, partial [Pseudomonas sp.]|uniref:hypothetical protein n=1 Tax=Pseudomonas sp. TaxID=306 RepID=UPI0025800535
IVLQAVDVQAEMGLVRGGKHPCPPLGKRSENDCDLTGERGKSRCENGTGTRFPCMSDAVRHDSWDTDYIERDR